MEPWLYGSSTGLSPLAIIVAAVFWTTLWGPVGLLLVDAAHRLPRRARPVRPAARSSSRSCSATQPVLDAGGEVLPAAAGRRSARGRGAGRRHARRAAARGGLRAGDPAGAGLRRRGPRCAAPSTAIGRAASRPRSPASSTAGGGRPRRPRRQATDRPPRPARRCCASARARLRSGRGRDAGASPAPSRAWTAAVGGARCRPAPRPGDRRLRRWSACAISIRRRRARRAGCVLRLRARHGGATARFCLARGGCRRRRSRRRRRLTDADAVTTGWRATSMRAVAMLQTPAAVRGTDRAGRRRPLGRELSPSP